MTIYKYPIESTDAQTVSMPKGAKILCVRTKNQAPQLWALVDPLCLLEPRQIFIFGTGHFIPKDRNLSYIGTYQIMGGQLVFHVFEELKKESK